jgi:RNA polymerase sigma factor (TIGR02999 family)
VDEEQLSSREEVTQLLCAAGNGNRKAEEKLMNAVYAELHRIANRHMRGERKGHTLQATALVHEAYLRLIDQRVSQWQNRAHFYSIAARTMRRVLVDHARPRGYAKRGGNAPRVQLDEALAIAETRAAEALVLDEVLDSLAVFDERKARVVELRFFGGLSVAETAEVLGVSEGTVDRDWTLAKPWIKKEMRREPADGR